MNLTCKCGFIHQNSDKLYIKRDYSGRRIAFCYFCDRRIYLPTIRAAEIKQMVRESIAKIQYGA